VLEAVPRVSFVAPPPDGVVVGVPEIAIPAAASAAAVAASATFAQGVVGACQRSRARALKAKAAADVYWMSSRGPNRKQPLQVSSGFPMKWA